MKMLLKLVLLSCCLSLPLVARAALLPRFDTARPELARAYRELEQGSARSAIVADLRDALASAKDKDQRQDLQRALEGIVLATASELRLAVLDKSSVDYRVLRLIESRSPAVVWWHEPGRYMRNDNTEVVRADGFDDVLRLGDAAIPALIEHLDDRSYTRIIMRSRLGGWPRVLPLNYAALCLIEQMTGCYFDLSAQGTGQEHIARWWKETARASRIERMKWQFPHASSIGMELMFAELRKVGQEEFLKASLRQRADWLRRPAEAVLLAQLGERAPFDESQATLLDSTRTPEIKSQAAMYMAAYGGEEQFRALARTVRREAGADEAGGDEAASKLLSQIFLSVSESRQEWAFVALEAFLKVRQPMEGGHWISAHPHAGILRYCDAALHFLAGQGRFGAFGITWKTEDRDEAIAAYLQQHPSEELEVD